MCFFLIFITDFTATLLIFSRAQAILDIVRTFLIGNTPFVLVPGYPKLLSGEMEGALGWLAANYLLGNIGNKKSAEETSTVLEMGGASSQVTTALSPNDHATYPRFLIKVGRYNITFPTHFGVQSLTGIRTSSTHIAI